MKQKSAEEAMNAEIAMSESMADFDAVQAQQTQYDATQLPDGVYSGSTTFEDAQGRIHPKMVPAEQVQPELRKYAAMEQMKAQAATISDPYDRLKFEANHTVAINNTYAKQFSARLASQYTRQTEVTNAHLNNARNAGNWDTFDKIWQNSPTVTEAERIEYAFESSKGREEDSIEQVFQNGSIEEVEGTLDAITSETYNTVSNEEIAQMTEEELAALPPGATGKLSESEQSTWARSLRTRLKQLKEGDKAERATAAANITKRAKAIGNYAAKGNYMAPQAVNEAREAIVANQDVLPEGTLEDFDINIEVNGAVREMMTEDFMTQNEKLTELKAEAEASGDPKAIEIYTKAEEAITSFQKEVQNSPVEAMEKYGLGRTEPIKDPYASTEQWDRRFDQVDSVGYQLGFEPPKYLSDIEATSLAKDLKSGSPESRIQKLRDLQATLGPEKSAVVLDQIGMKAPSLRVQSMMKFDAVERSMEGLELLQDPAGKSSVPSTQEYREEFDKHFGNTFKGKGKLRNGMMETSRALYAYHANELGITDADFNDEVWERVVADLPQTVSIELGDNEDFFIAPMDPNTNLPATTDEFEEAVYDIPKEHFENADSILYRSESKDYDPGLEFKEDLENGTIEMIPQGHGVFGFRIRGSSVGNLIVDKDGKPILWEYGKEYDYDEKEEYSTLE